MAMSENPLGATPSTLGASPKKRPGDISDVMANLGVPGGLARPDAAPKVMHSPMQPGLAQPKLAAPMTAFGAGQATRDAIGAGANAAVTAGKAIGAPNMRFLQRAGEFGRGLFGAATPAIPPASASPIASAQAAPLPRPPVASANATLLPSTAGQGGALALPRPSLGQQANDGITPVGERTGAPTEVLGIFNGRPITRAESDRLSGPVPRPTVQPAAASGNSALGPIDDLIREVKMRGLNDQGNRDLLAKLVATRASATDLPRPTQFTDAEGNLLSVSGSTASQITGSDGAPVRAPMPKAEGVVTPAMRFKLDGETFQTLLANPPQLGDDAGAAAYQAQLSALQQRLASYGNQGEQVPPGMTLAGTTKDGKKVYRDASGKYHSYE